MATVIQVRPARSIGQAFGEGLQVGVQQGLKRGFQQQLQEDDQEFRLRMQRDGKDPNDPTAVAAYKEARTKEEIKLTGARYRELVLQNRDPEQRTIPLTQYEQSGIDFDAERSVRGGAQARTDYDKKYGALPADAEGLTPAAAAKTLTSTALRLNPRDLRPGYVTLDAKGNPVATEKLTGWAKDRGLLMVASKEKTPVALQEIQLDPNERARKYATAYSGLNALVQEFPADATTIPTDKQAEFDSFAADLRHYAGPTAIQSAAGKGDLASRAVLGEKVLLPGVEQKVLQAQQAFTDETQVGVDKGNEIIKWLADNGHMEEASKLATGAGAKARAGVRAVRVDERGEAQLDIALHAQETAEARERRLAREAAGRETTRQQATVRFEEWQKNVVEGKTDFYVDALTGEPISDKPLRFAEAQALAEGGTAIPRGVAEARRDMTIWVDEKWDPRTDIQLDKIVYASINAIDPTDPDHGNVKGKIPLALARIRAQAVERGRAAVRLKPTQTQQLEAEWAVDFAARYTIPGKLSPRQKSYVRLLSPSTIRNVEVKGARGESLSAHVDKRLSKDKFKQGLIVAFGTETEGYEVLKNRYITAGDRLFEMLAQTHRNELPNQGRFLRVLGDEMDKLITPFFEEGVTATTVAEWEQKMDVEGLSVEDVAAKAYRRLTSKEAPAAITPARAEPVMQSSGSERTVAPPGGLDEPGVVGLDTLTESDIYVGDFAADIPMLRTAITTFVESKGVNPTRAQIEEILSASGFSPTEINLFIPDYIRQTKDTRITTR